MGKLSDPGMAIRKTRNLWIVETSKVGRRAVSGRAERRMMPMRLHDEED